MGERAGIRAASCTLRRSTRWTCLCARRQRWQQALLFPASVVPVIPSQWHYPAGQQSGLFPRTRGKRSWSPFISKGTAQRGQGIGTLQAGVTLPLSFSLSFQPFCLKERASACEKRQRRVHLVKPQPADHWRTTDEQVLTQRLDLACYRMLHASCLVKTGLTEACYNSCRESRKERA